MAEIVLRGVPLRDWPLLMWLRLTYCRRHGHQLGPGYCVNCGAPW